MHFSHTSFTGTTNADDIFRDGQFHIFEVDQVRYPFVWIRVNGGEGKGAECEWIHLNKRNRWKKLTLYIYNLLIKRQIYDFFPLGILQID